jgi:hypothetical protein
MKYTVKTRLQSVQVGQAQTYKKRTMLPLLAPASDTSNFRVGPDPRFC